MIIARYSLDMTISAKSDLHSFSEGTATLARRPFVTLGLAALGMVLAALAPVLQARFNLPSDEVTASALLFAALFPLEMYFIPKFLAEADAHAGELTQDPRGNPLEDWERLFDERWLRSMAGKFLLSVAVGLGLLCLVIPGIVLFFAFGWVPLRVLLRGESLVEAARGSYQLMTREWRRVVQIVLLLVGINLAILILLSFLSGAEDPHALPLADLTRPRFWVLNFISILQNLWTSACLLALFRRVEVPRKVELP